MLLNSLQSTGQSPMTKNHTAPLGNRAEVDRPWSRHPQGPGLSSCFHAIPAWLGVRQPILFWGSVWVDCSHFDTHTQGQQNSGGWSRILLLEEPQAVCKKLMMKASCPKELRSADMHLLNKEGWSLGIQFLQPPSTSPPAFSLLGCLTVSPLTPPPSSLFPQVYPYCLGPWQVPRSWPQHLCSATANPGSHHQLSLRQRVGSLSFPSDLYTSW